jgi:hypothetical protein
MTKTARKYQGRKSFVSIRVYSWLKQKSHVRRIAWLKSPVRHRTLAPFGGITRIRFKGFDRPFAPIISARRLPRTFFLGQNKTGLGEVNATDCGCMAHVGAGQARNPANALPAAKLLTRSTRRLLPASRSCERSPAIAPYSSSRQKRRCKFRFGLSHRTCLQLQPCTS